MKLWLKIIFILFFVICLILSGTVFFLWQKIKKFEPIVYYQLPPEKTFIYSKEESIFGIEDYLKEVTEKEMSRLLKEKKDFVYVNLQEMKLTLYQEGEEFKSFPIAAKGADWFWGKTAPGLYYPDFFSRLHFSSIANLWMPYAIRYWGNYFIHGWPYDVSGRLISSRVSGGCIRLKTADAKVVFEFVKEGMPILIFDEEIKKPLFSLTENNKEITPLQINSDSILIADLDSGEILLDKEADSLVSAGPAVKIMLALTAAETVNLKKKIVARNWMFEGLKEGVIQPGKIYQGDKLLNLLFSKSSSEVALVLARFLTPEDFVELMNTKTKAIGMKDSFFKDITGQSSENKTTLFDVARMMRYLKNHRNFIFKKFEKISEKTEEGKSSGFSVFKMKFSENKMKFSENQKEKDEEIRFIFVGIIGSPNIEKDFKIILEWLNENFNLIKI